MQQVDEQLYTPQEVADYLKVDVRTVYRWLREGDLNALRFRREYRISESDLREFIQRHRTGREGENDA
jgi:excisionase family DNA binding protein